MSREPVPAFLRAPVPLGADNFTPLARTPWGGDVIGRRFKAGVVPAAVGQRIGEAWEFSCDPAFPSRLVGVPAEAGLDLLALVRRWPEAVLSPALVRGGEDGCQVLVKLLNAAEPLSLQVHPGDDDPNLTAGECGKPESWLVLAAEPGAGIYLGFSRPVAPAALRAALLAGDQARALLHFEPVAPGDYFEIEPGVPHAIGGGVTLLEPQRVLPGRAGKTFRLWDWGRRYDRDGRFDPGGEARGLHIDAGLAVIDPERQVGPAFAASLRRRPRTTVLAGGEVRTYPANPYYQTVLATLTAGSRVRLSVDGGYGALIVLRGGLTAGGVQLAAGQPALLPHAALPLDLNAMLGSEASEFALVAPASATVSFA